MPPKTSKVSSDDLLDILEETKPDEPKKENNNPEWTQVERFIRDFGLLDGNKKIHANIVYQTFKEFRKYIKNRVSYRFFVNRLKWYYEHGTDMYGLYFYLDDYNFDLSEDFMWRMRSNRIKQREKAKNKKKSQQKK